MILSLFIPKHGHVFLRQHSNRFRCGLLDVRTPKALQNTGDYFKEYPSVYAAEGFTLVILELLKAMEALAKASLFSHLW
jgi:hypothetical protein